MKRLALLFLLLATTAHAEERRYRSLVSRDMDALSSVLRRHVAYLTIEPKRGDSPISPVARNAYAAVLEPQRLVALAHLVDDADAIHVKGPKGSLVAKVVLMDKKRRVAILETTAGLDTIGLFPAPRSTAERKIDMELFALISTEGESGVLHTVLTHKGDIPEYEGHPRIDLKLTAGMPVFDDRAHLFGYSRVLAWDSDRFMVVPLEKVDAARTSTGAAAAPPPPKAPEKPWWAR